MKNLNTKKLVYDALIYLLREKKAIPYYNYHPVEENIYDHVQADESIYDDIINVTRKVGVNVSTFPYQTIF